MLAVVDEYLERRWRLVQKLGRDSPTPANTGAPVTTTPLPCRKGLIDRRWVVPSQGIENVAAPWGPPRARTPVLSGSGLGEMIDPPAVTR